MVPKAERAKLKKAEEKKKKEEEERKKAAAAPKAVAEEEEPFPLFPFIHRMGIKIPLVQDHLSRLYRPQMMLVVKPPRQGRTPVPHPLLLRPQLRPLLRRLQNCPLLE